jgi:hypothetical protein
MKLQCSVLGEEGRIPPRHAYRFVAGGRNVSPPLAWSGVPAGTRQLCLALIDLHPVARRWIHWALTGIPPEAVGIPEGASGRRDLLPPGCKELTNSYGEIGYGGPNPPAGTGSHEYVFTLYALSSDRPVPSALFSSPAIERELRDSLLACASVSGTFSR